MDIKKIGILLIFIGIVLTVAFINNQQIFVPALTVTVLGFFMTVLGYVVDIRKRKIINDQLDGDITNVIQPLITKYSNLNKQYKQEFEGDEYVSKRLELNSSLERELTENLPYLESREIKKIVIQFSKEQDRM
ncbi:hypothetical protein [uncultured Methanobrevibacter sp.]|uniref:hypothetical protein n=1 Tax=uncultured Methanobrevibacter sp. TaxID=253161 RepID=UPI0025E70BC5|nr:hypothetical protein [uncultured Methanobrevibacter sp.]